MATKKDLVEAYSFSRRRLVTAFVSGAPGGREVEPSRSGRTIVGGVALAILVVAGGAILGVLNSRTEVDWNQAGLISAKDTSADYVILGEDSPLRPVANITSAMLLLEGGLNARTVPDDEIAVQDRGAPIGILSAPETPPDPDLLIQSGWTACTGEDFETKAPYGLKLSLLDTSQVTPTPGVGMVVRGGDKLYLLAEALGLGERDTPRAYAYKITDDSTADRILQAVTDLAADSAVKVPPGFLALFPPGGALTLSSFGIPKSLYGEASTDQANHTVPDKAKFGDYIAVGDDKYVLTPTGALKLDAFSEKVYLNLGFPKGERPHRYSGDVAPDINSLGSRDLANVVWPEDVLAPKTVGQYCAMLDVAAVKEPGTRLATTDAGSAAGSEEIASGSVEKEVESGHGAVISSGDYDSQGSAQPMLIDDRAFAYPLVGDAHDLLGYSGVPDVVVPDEWVQLFNSGVSLSVDAARCPPTSEEQTGPCQS